jgi:hypothetical protein
MAANTECPPSSFETPTSGRLLRMRPSRLAEERLAPRMRASFTLAQDEGTTNTGVKAWMAGTSPAMTNIV